MNEDRLFNLIPNYIPDYCLQRENANEMWAHLILQAYKKVYFLQLVYFILLKDCKIFVFSFFFLIVIVRKDILFMHLCPFKREIYKCAFETTHKNDTKEI